ncbi:hypothetical protein [Actinoplanes teichomyceticus]|uniref:ABC-type transport system involved in multi-copper enzyme maturation permease subunit n=1 Tax=Actinoplanes teichomyceticus TaxID=1867 RepID=A0A561WR01_ACTTI|nr:hypothetical protein [Actinoplanes teichomyceticus]TWG26258.1 hypothetical protein FHX34_1011239 [Actinoplanes teichomyceticus]GIF11337.1 hypothetical protein Ate01nite_13690 [Actinoplanes teichomyceticus]
MSHVLRIELRRSAAPGTALIVLVTGAALLYFASGSASGSEWAAGWMQLAMTQRLYLVLLWPLALAAGAWQGRREAQSNVGELFASTPRPRARRIVPTLGAMALAVIAGYLLMSVAGGVAIIGTAGYLPARILAVVAVGALALLAAVWLGLAAGRLVPHLMTAPALAVAGLGLLLGIPWATRPRGWLALVFSPIYEMNMPHDYATVPWRVSGSQAIWLAGLAVAAVLLFASGGWRSRVAALLPVGLGAALSIAVMPHQNRLVIDSVDPVAKALVCADDEPRICVSRVHAGLLPELVGPAREALTVLARLPGAPSRVHEDNTTYLPFAPAPRPADTVLLPVEVGAGGHLAERSAVLPETVTAAFVGAPGCDGGPDRAQARAAAYWLLGREPARGSRYEDPEAVDAAKALWARLRALPADRAAAQVAAVRKAALECAP